LSGRLVKIEILAKQILQDEVCNHLKGNLNLRMLGLESHLRQSSRSWSSSHNAWFSGKKVAQDYIQRFNQDVLDYFETWVEKYFYPEILKPSIERLERAIEQEIQDIELELNSLVSQPQGKSFNWVFAKYFKFGAEVDFGLGGIIGTIFLGLAMLIPGILFGPVLTTILGVLFGGGTTLAGLGSLLDIDSKIKEYVIQEGLKKFQDSRSQVLDTVERTVKATFDDRVQAFENVVKNAMSVYENRLEQLSKLDSETAEQRQAEKAWIVEHRQKLETAKQEIEEILSSMLKGTH
ncbi:MAG: hypothetical protein WBG66_03725, partial [Geitlerinemataceae cyanobacterium]